MQFIHFGLLLSLLASNAAAVGDQIVISASQSRSLGIETVPLAAASLATGNALPARVLVPNQQIRVVSAPLAGMVESLPVATGQSVKKGQLLLRLQSPGLAELERDFLQAALLSQLSGNALKRDEQLFKDGIIAESRYLATQNAALSSAAAAREKRQALALAGVGEAAIAGLSAGRAANSALELTAPITGVVLEQMAEPGQRVEAAAPLFKVASLSPLWLEIQAPIGQASKLALGATVKVPNSLSPNSLPRGERDAESLRDAQITGKVISVGRSVSEANQTVLVRAEISEGAANLRPGQFVEAVIGISGSAGQWAVPGNALARVGAQAYVFVQTPAGYRAQPVKVVSQTPESITVSGGLRGDERVVSKGAVALKAAWQGLGGE